MTKVWVPIDLPVTATGVRKVIVYNDLGEWSIEVSGPIIERERWEYRVMLRNPQTEDTFMADTEWLTVNGWRLLLTCAATSGGIEFWFERRLS